MLAGFAEKATTKGWRDAWLAHQNYIALGNLMASAALLEIATCPMEGFDSKAYDELLGMRAKGYLSGVCCALGYRAADDKYAALPKVRYPVTEVMAMI